MNAERSGVARPAALRRRGSRFRSCTLVVVVAGQVLSPVARAADDLDAEPALALSYFGTLGLATATNREAQFVRDLSQPFGVSGGEWSAKLDSMLGIQASYGFSDRVEGTAQVVSRYRNDASWTPELTWAFLKYQPTPGAQLRLGRLGTDLFMLADSRFVGYSYLPVRPPVDYFFTLPFFHIDGFDAAYTALAGDGLLRAKAYVGVSSERLPFLTDRWQLDLDGSLTLGGNISYQRGHWTFRLGFAQVQFNHESPLEQILVAEGVPVPLAVLAADALAVEDTRARFYSADLAYDRGSFQLQLSLNKVDQESAYFHDSHAGYVLAGYRVGALTPYAAYSWVRSSQDTVGTGIAAADSLIAGLASWTHSEQDTCSLGLRWDFRRNMDVKVQWDAIRGTPESDFPFQRDTENWRGRTDVYSVTMDFAF